MSSSSDGELLLLALLEDEENSRLVSLITKIILLNSCIYNYFLKGKKESGCMKLIWIGWSMENAFWILAHKWRIFYRPIETKTTTTILIIKTA